MTDNPPSFVERISQQITHIEHSTQIKDCLGETFKLREFP